MLHKSVQRRLGALCFADDLTTVVRAASPVARECAVSNRSVIGVLCVASYR